MKHVVFVFVIALGIIGCSKDDNHATGPSAPYVPSALTITREAVYGPGMSFTYGALSEPIPFNVDSAGPNRTWRFINTNWAGHFTSTYHLPIECPFGTQFPTATRGVEFSYDWNSGETAYSYERVDSIGIWTLGTSNTAGYTPYHQPYCWLKLPCEYGTEWTEALWDSSDNPVYPYWRVDSITWKCDAWGLMVTPYDSCSVLRNSRYHRSYYKGPYDSIPRLEESDLDYFWLDEHGDQVAWASSTFNTLNPYFISGYINLRTKKHAVSAPAAASPWTPNAAPQTQGVPARPQVVTPFLGNWPIH